MFALLVGCWELLKLGALLAIIDGDSFSSIQWGSWKISHPWRLTNWVEEAQDISSQHEASFHHILREANATADGLAKDGVFRDSVSFDD